MTQIATVEKTFDNGTAEISVPRKSACGHDCEQCAGCGVTGTAVHAVARNPVGAQVGQKVVVESSTQKLYRMMLIVYILPVVFFFLGYFCSAALPGTGLRYGIAIVAFCLGIIPAVRYDRRVKKAGGLTFTIVRLF